jgi:hypothetical protein
MFASPFVVYFEKEENTCHDKKERSVHNCIRRFNFFVDFFNKKMSVSFDSYSVEIFPDVGIAASEKSDGSYYVKMPGNNCKYAIKLTNSRSTRCDAKVTVDDDHVGTFRLEPYGSLRLERPTYSQGRFTFFIGGSRESHQAGYRMGDGANGLIKVSFTPEKRRIVRLRRNYADFGVKSLNANLENSYCASAITSSNYQEGMSGLSGHSKQKFHEVAELDYDYDNEATIMLRLVGNSESQVESTILPLNSRRTTPYPEPVSRGISPLWV